MRLFFLEAANQPLTKRFSLSETNTLQVTAYPNTKNFTSYEEEVSNIKEFYDAVKRHAASGNQVLLKGHLQRPLINESRAGASPRETATQWICFDIDGLNINSINDFLTQVNLRDIQHIIQWSSSYGVTRDGQPIKPGIRAHLYMMLEEPVSALKLKEWLKTICIQYFNDQMDLSPTGHSLTWPLDPSVAENSKLIYIAAPEVTPPFVDTCADRFILVEEGAAALKSGRIEQAKSASELHQLTERKVQEIRNHKNLPRRRTKMKQYKTFNLLVNPERATMTYMGTEREFDYYNINDGDSNAYYHPSNNPDIIFSFKPDELAFHHSAVDPESYTAAVERAIQFRLDNNEVIYGVGRDRLTDKHFAYEYLAKSKDLDILGIDKRNIEDHLANYDQILPNPIPNWDLEFNPSDERLVDYEKRWMNLHTDNEYGKEFRGIPLNESYNYEWGPNSLKSICPVIHELIGHVLAWDEPTYKWFLNWIAHIVQIRSKPKTAIVIHGVPGTGKNLLVEKVIVPLVGKQYYQEVRIEQFKDQFLSAVLKTCKLLMINEANQIGMGRQAESQGDFLKTLITEDSLSIRQMRKESQMLTTYNAVIVASNNYSPILIDEGDRRFTVAPRQEQRLLKLMELNILSNFPTIIEEIDKELYKFAKFLYSYKVEPEYVASTLENEAKSALKAAGKTADDEFCDAIKGGNLDFFIENLPSDIMKMTFSDTPFTYTNAAKEILCGYIRSIGTSYKVSRDELMILYQISSHSKPLSNTHFSKMLSRHGLQLTSGMRREGIDKQFKGVHITWHLFNCSPDEALQAVTEIYQGDEVVRTNLIN